MADVWPESTCAECGKNMPSGTVRKCERGGWCRWHVPHALRERLISLEASCAAMTKALEGINRILSPGHRTMDELMRDMDFACDRARAALTQANGEGGRDGG